MADESWILTFFEPSSFSPYPAGVEHERLQVGDRLEQLQQAIALHRVVVEEERIGAGHPKTLARLGSTPG